MKANMTPRYDRRGAQAVLSLASPFHLLGSNQKAFVHSSTFIDHHQSILPLSLRMPLPRIRIAAGVEARDNDPRSEWSVRTVGHIVYCKPLRGDLFSRETSAGMGSSWNWIPNHTFTNVSIQSIDILTLQEPMAILAIYPSDSRFLDSSWILGSLTLGIVLLAGGTASSQSRRF
jgi:hypothetical protein